MNTPNETTLSAIADLDNGRNLSRYVFDEDIPNSEVRGALDRIIDGTEQLYGPFKDVSEMIDHILHTND